jgi:hypothetical protein
MRPTAGADGEGEVARGSGTNQYKKKEVSSDDTRAPNSTPTLADLNISYQQSSDWPDHF